MALSCRNSDPSRMDQCVNESLQQWERGWGGTKEAVPICGWGGTEEAVSILCQKRKTLQTWVLNNGRNSHLLPRGQRRAFWMSGVHKCIESLSSVADLRPYIVLVIWTCIYQDRVKGDK